MLVIIELGGYRYLVQDCDNEGTGLLPISEGGGAKEALDVALDILEGMGLIDLYEEWLQGWHGVEPQRRT